MAKKNLIDTLEKLNRDLEKSSEAYRTLVSNKEAHYIVLNKKAECSIKVSTHNFERQGADSFIYGNVLNGEDKIIARVPHDYDYKNHETIDFHFDYTNMHCFDSNTGLRL